MEQDKSFEKEFAEMWQNLNAEQRALILQQQQNQLKKATTKAKKISTRRALDKQDRDKLFFALEEAGCSEMMCSLATMRTLALRWILSDSACQDSFCEYVMSLQEKRLHRKSITG